MNIKNVTERFDEVLSVMANKAAGGDVRAAQFLLDVIDRERRFKAAERFIENNKMNERLIEDGIHDLLAAIHEEQDQNQDSYCDIPFD